MEHVWNILIDIAALAFVFIAIGFCIFSHELGHFLAAKWRGLHIDAFSLGFRAFWKKKIGGVESRLGWLPFGGYVELPQVDATDSIPKAADGTELPRAKPLDRIITAVAGPLFNILSGLLLACLVWWIGMPQDSPKMREIEVMEIEADSPEFRAGLRTGDKIIALNGKPIFDTWSGFVQNVLFSVGEIELDVRRGSEELKVRYIPIDNPKAPGSLAAEGIAWPFFSAVIPMELTPLKGSPAEKAGIQPGDTMLKVDGKPIQDYLEFQLALNRSQGAPVLLTLRDKSGATREVSVTPTRVDSHPTYLMGIIMRNHPGTPGIFVGEIAPDSLAEKGGLKPGDRLRKIADQSIDAPEHLIEKLQALKDTPFNLTIERDGQEITLPLAAEASYPYTIGVDITLTDHPTPIQQFVATLQMSWKSLRGIVVGVANQLGLTEETSSLKPSHMSGPLGMGTVLFTSIRNNSIMTGIYFTVVISFALAIFNLFPFPVLDGGHILFGVVELIFGRPLPTPVIKTLSMIFVVLLIGLMVFVTFSDGRRIYRNIFRGQTDTVAPPTEVKPEASHADQPATQP